MLSTEVGRQWAWSCESITNWPDIIVTDTNPSHMSCLTQQRFNPDGNTLCSNERVPWYCEPFSSVVLFCLLRRYLSGVYNTILNKTISYYLANLRRRRCCMPSCICRFSKYFVVNYYVFQLIKNVRSSFLNLTNLY